jgi:homoserine O-acetyltransferase
VTAEVSVRGWGRTVRVASLAVQGFAPVSCLLLALWALGCGSEQQVASLGDLPLESGAAIRECRIGYRTFGQLDAARSNAVLFTCWFEGTSRDLAGMVGPGKLLDSSRYYVIAVDALGNGVSSSPSNSRLQPGPAFPRFSVRDLVESQYRLVTRVLGLSHLRAVVGISLGGMQAFQWATSHPELVDKTVPIAGSARSSPGDRRRWQALADELSAESAWRRAARELTHRSPLRALRQIAVDADDHTRQAQAIISHDVAATLGGSMQRAAAATGGRMLVVVSARDEVVETVSALEFARLAGAEVLELDGRCGHDAPSCEEGTLGKAVTRFLDR